MGIFSEFFFNFILGVQRALKSFKFLIIKITGNTKYNQKHQGIEIEKGESLFFLYRKKDELSNKLAKNSIRTGPYLSSFPVKYEQYSAAIFDFNFKNKS
jgi:hypothetical protein